MKTSFLIVLGVLALIACAAWYYFNVMVTSSPAASTNGNTSSNPTGGSFLDNFFGSGGGVSGGSFIPPANTSQPLPGNPTVNGAAILLGPTHKKFNNPSTIAVA